MICTDFQKMFSEIQTLGSLEKKNCLYKQTDFLYGAKLQTIEPTYASLFFSPLMGEKREVKVEKFKKGDVFALQGVECDDFSMPVKEYEVIKKVDEIFGIQLDGLVVKQISGDASTVFSLTKTDCQTLGFEFQPRLLFFPMNMNWKEVIISQHEKIKEFNPLDMSTYPVFKETKLIERIVVRINNIRQICGDIFCNDFKISNKELMGGFMLVVKKNIPVRNGMLKQGQVIYGMNVTSGVFRHSGLLINDNSIYFEFCVNGIEPSIVEGYNLHDLFEVKVMGMPIVKNTCEEIDEKVVKAIKNAMEKQKKIVNFDSHTGTLELMDDLYKKNYGRTRQNNDYRWKWSRDYWESDDYELPLPF